MTLQESLLAAISERVVLAPYDRAWPGLFEQERSRLLSLLPGTFVAIEHIGSTAIPQMVAKPIVDILGGVVSFAEVADVAARLCENGDTTSRDLDDMLPDRKWFLRCADGRRTHHLHVIVHGGTTWQEHLAFRDRLRVDAEAAARYASLKTSLALQHRDDREAYTDGKTAFVRSVIASSD